MKKKTAIICMVVCLLMTAIIVGAIVLDVSRKQAERETADPQQTEAKGSETSDVSAPGQDITVPDIKDEPAVTAREQGNPDIDVSEMTRNPEPEVIDRTIEYETKEIQKDE